MSTTPTSLDARRSTAAGRGPTAARLLSLTKEEPSGDYYHQAEGTAEQQGEETVSVDTSKEERSASARGDSKRDDADAAHAAAVAAAAEEVASAESHSLTQGAMKLVYLLAIQVHL